MKKYILVLTTVSLLVSFSMVRASNPVIDAEIDPSDITVVVPVGVEQDITCNITGGDGCYTYVWTNNTVSEALTSNYFTGQTSDTSSKLSFTPTAADLGQALDISCSVTDADGTTNILPADATVLVPALAISEVTYSGDGQIPLYDASNYGDDSGTPITGPDWTSSNQNTICYVGGSSPTLEIKFDITPDLGGLIYDGAKVEANATIENSTATLTYDATPITLSGNTTTIDNFTTSDKISSAVGKGKAHYIVKQIVGTVTQSSTIGNFENWLFQTHDSPGSIDPISMKRFTWIASAIGFLSEDDRKNGDKVAAAFGAAIMPPTDGAGGGGCFNPANTTALTGAHRLDNEWEALDNNQQGADCGTIAGLFVDCMNMAVFNGADKRLVYPCCVASGWNPWIWNHDAEKGYKNAAGATLIYLDGPGLPNGYEGCAWYDGVWWGGGLGNGGPQGNPFSSPDAILKVVSNPNNNDMLNGKQVYDNDQTHFVDYPSGHF